MLKSIDASLKRLQTDYIDGYLMHRDDRVGDPHRETIACTKGAEERGKVRFWACPIWSAIWQTVCWRTRSGYWFMHPYNMINRTK